MRSTPRVRYSGPRLTRREVLIGMAALGLSACMPRGTGEGGGYVFGIPDPAAVPGLPNGLFALGVWILLQPMQMRGVM